MFWDDFIGESSSNSNNNDNSNTKKKGKQSSIDEEFILYNIIDDDNVPLEFFTETSGRPRSESSVEVIDLDNDDNIVDDNKYIYISDNESRSSDVILVQDCNDNNNNSNNNNNNNDRNNDNNISEDELLALRLQLEEEEAYQYRMAELQRVNENRIPDFFDFDDFGAQNINTLYNSINDDFESPMFLNSRGYVMDLRNYVDDGELDDSYEGLLRLEERIGNVKHNLNKSQINKNKALKYDKDNKEIQETKCSICLLNYEKNDELRILLCTHSFHKECIDNWFKTSSTCPICRTDLKELKK